MELEEFNSLSPADAMGEIKKCCGSTSWAAQIIDRRPYSYIADLKDRSDEIWQNCTGADALEAFSHHPKIGDLRQAEKKFPASAQWAGREQSGLTGADPDVLSDMVIYNREYEQKFGYIFIICATGLSGEEMLAALKSRINNDPDTELAIAKEEQNKITKLRIDKLFS
jgi:2-oxo-4-hydroxy-4-carboxy-5-ureidoimidazoline decarboxylase